MESVIGNNCGLTPRCNPSGFRRGQHRATDSAKPSGPLAVATASRTDRSMTDAFCLRQNAHALHLAVGKKSRAPAVAGIDIGATKTVAVLVLGRHVVASKKIPTPRRGFAKTVDAAAGLADEIGAGRAGKIGVCVAGQVGDGTVYFMPNLGLRGKFGISRQLEKKTGLVVRADNDGHCFALGEWKMGAGRGYGDILGVALGTGIGGGVISCGRLLCGAHNQAGEIGHMKIAAGGKKCACGGHGCFERYCGGAGIEKDYFEVTGKRADAKTIMRMGDSASCKIAIRAANHLGIALASLANVFDSGIIVLGGSLSEAFCKKPLFGIVKKIYAKECLPGLVKVKIVRAKLEYPSAVGAALLFG